MAKLKEKVVDIKSAEKTVKVPVTIPKPDLRVAQFNLIGTAPYVMFRFSKKVEDEMRERFGSEATGSKKRARTKRDYEADYEAALHRSRDGWIGVPASAFRAAMISVCRLVNFKMTLAKMSIFIMQDGFDAADGMPLVKMEGKPKMFQSITRNANGMPDLRTRAMFDEWSIRLRVRYDAAQFTETDVANLLSRVGMQAGIGEGRPDSKNSAGMGWGTFEIGE